MSKITSIQWCHSTVNPVMGCDGCELYPTLAIVRSTLTDVINSTNAASTVTVDAINNLTADGPQATKLKLDGIAATLATIIEPESKIRQTRIKAQIQKRVSDLFICYAATLHRFANTRGLNPGFAYPFESPALFPGRVAKVSLLPSPAEREVSTKPWLKGYPRLVFISDMGDALSRDVSFQYLHDEIIRPVTSKTGERHIWQWLTKRPSRMARFSQWLNNQGIDWPDNLVAMTSVSGPKSINRVKQLTQVSARYRGLSVEPLWDRVDLPLEGISWVIVGGQSGKNAKPFHLEWAEQIRDDCHRNHVAFFCKQLGRRPFAGEKPINLLDAHGGDWSEWPDNLRIRELPPAWRFQN